jgi:hypothetical protein
MLEVGTGTMELVSDDGMTEPVRVLEVANEPVGEVLVVMKEPVELVLEVEGSALLLVVGRAGHDSWKRAVTLTDTTVPVNELK